MRDPFDPTPTPRDVPCLAAMLGGFVGDVFERVLGWHGLGSLLLWGMAIGGSLGLLWRLRHDR